MCLSVYIYIYIYIDVRAYTYIYIYHVNRPGQFRMHPYQCFSVEGPRVKGALPHLQLASAWSLLQFQVGPFIRASIEFNTPTKGTLVQRPAADTLAENHQNPLQARDNSQQPSPKHPHDSPESPFQAVAPKRKGIALDFDLVENPALGSLTGPMGMRGGGGGLGAYMGSCIERGLN